MKPKLLMLSAIAFTIAVILLVALISRRHYATICYPPPHKPLCVSHHVP